METKTTSVPSRWQRRRTLLVQDFFWTLFVVILLLVEPERNKDALILVPLIGIFQIWEPRLAIFRSTRGQIVAIAIKLLLCYFLIGFSDAVFSNYYLSFLIPVVGAATIFNLAGVLVVVLLAVCGYLSFLLPTFVDWNRLPPDYLSVMLLRASFYAIVGFLVYQQAKAKRDEMARTEEALDRLVVANRNLQLAEASLRRSERLAALGQLTAGLAHELRNPLGTIKASAEMLTKLIEQPRHDLMCEMAEYITSEVDRINGLIASFLDFARPLRMKASRNQLLPLIEDIFRQQHDLAANRGVRLTLHNDEPGLAFTFDPDLMRVALSNLIQNAIQASSAGGEVEVRVAPHDDQVRILVIDHGEGIQPEHLESIFNPFFTTKAQGVGLGLALVSKTVDEHGGRINVFSEPGKGTTFEVMLPQEQPA